MIRSREEIIAFARGTLDLSGDVSLELSPLQGRGSDRTFFRLRWGRDGSVILVRYDPKRLENTYYAGIAVFLHEIEVPVPGLIRHDPEHCLILMEDLGDMDLWSLREAPWENRRILYQKTLAAIHKLHCLPERDFPSDRVNLMEGFGPDLYRWERDYFRNHLIGDVCGVEQDPVFERELETELSHLAERLTGTMRCLIHRDLQSQNVMVRGGEPFFIDFQGMRFGSLYYDLGSLLCDPYVNFSDRQRDDLLSFYYSLAKRPQDRAAFQDTFWEASAQRLMQALGAYGFLGIKKGLRSYLDHIPAGLRHLHLAASRVPSLPRLRELSVKCRHVLDQRRENP